MKLLYLGTAAAEGLPASFCNCAICENARRVGGREVRSRAQLLVDGELLIDFPPDTYYHCLLHGLYLGRRICERAGGYPVRHFQHRRLGLCAVTL